MKRISARTLLAISSRCIQYCVMDISTSRTVSVFIVNRGRVLLLLRDDKPTIPNPNKWSAIGGFVEQGESAEDAARREALEETGLVLEGLEYVGEETYESGRVSTRFLAVISDEKANRICLGDEGQALRFFTFVELADIPLSGSIRRYYDMCPDVLSAMLAREIFC